MSHAQDAIVVAKIARSDSLVIATPEYNMAIPEFFGIVTVSAATTVWRSFAQKRRIL